jgi:hypothetical protein
MHFPEQQMDWEYLLDQFASSSRFSFQSDFIERLQFLVMCSMSDSVEALAFKVWRDHITNMNHAADFNLDNDNNSNIIRRIRAKVAHFEGELPKLKEITTILELALWKMRINQANKQEKRLLARRKERLMNQVFGSFHVSPVELTLLLGMCCHIFSCLQWMKNQTSNPIPTITLN